MLSSIFIVFLHCTVLNGLGSHLAAAVLTRTLLPILKATPGDVRIIIISSWGHRYAPSSDFTSISGWNATRGNSMYKKNHRYSITKCMNILWAAHQHLHFAKTPGLEHVMVLALDPGFVNTGMPLISCHGAVTLAHRIKRV